MKISIKNIYKRFGETVALDNVTLEFKNHAFTTLLGPSGCGKTTLLRIIAGLETPDEGELYFDDVCVFSKSKKINVPPEKRGLAFVFQDFALWPHMTVYENVAFGLRAKKSSGATEVEIAEKVKEALRSVQLLNFADRHPHELSGGQQQRVAFARAIAINPHSILFDEPLSALDALLREEMRAELKRMVHERNITSIFVTHDQMEALSISDEIAVFDKGKVLQKGSPEEIYQQPNSKIVANFVGKSNWIDETKMVRPENIFINETPGQEKEYSAKQMRVKEVLFLGKQYEVIVSDRIHTWSVHTKRKCHPNEDVTIYINEASLVKF